MKDCVKCRLPKPLDEFCPVGTASDGRDSRCRDCRRLDSEARRRRNGIKPRRKTLECDGDYKQCAKCEEILALTEFNDRCKAQGKQSYCRRCMAGYKKTPEKNHRDAKAFRDRDPSWWRFLSRTNSQLYRARKRNLDSGLVTPTFLASLYSETRCTYCRSDVDPSDRTIDHVVPLAKGGPHHPDNLVMACGGCNSRKKDRDLEEFLSTLEITR